MERPAARSSNLEWPGEGARLPTGINFLLLHPSCIPANPMVISLHLRREAHEDWHHLLSNLWRQRCRCY